MNAEMWKTDVKSAPDVPVGWSSEALKWPYTALPNGAVNPFGFFIVVICE